MSEEKKPAFTIEHEDPSDLPVTRLDMANRDIKRLHSIMDHNEATWERERKLHAARRDELLDERIAIRKVLMEIQADLQWAVWPYGKLHKKIIDKIKKALGHD